MADRPDDKAHARVSIVPKHDDALLLPHRTAAANRRPRVWPLYLLVLLCLGVLAAGGVQYWQDRQHWQHTAAALESRLTQIGRSIDDAGSALNRGLARLGEAQARQEDRLEQLARTTQASEQMTRLDARITQLEQADGTRQETLAALQQSLDALESILKQTRDTMAARLSALDQTITDLERRSDEEQRRLAELGERVDAQDGSVTELREQQRRGHDMEERLAELQQQVEALHDENDRLNGQVQELHARQTALAAEQEMLGNQFGGALDSGQHDNREQGR